MIIKTRKITYNSYKKILNKVAYKLIKSGKTYKHTKNKYFVGNETKTFKEILQLIKKNGKNTNNNKFIARFMEDVITNTNYKQLPTSIIGSSGKYKYYRGHYRGMVKTVQTYKKKHGENPSEITVNYEKITQYKKYGRSTEYGCNNRGQNNSYYCAPHMVQEIIRNLTGKVIPQKTLAEVIRTTTDGSDHDGINTSFEWFNHKYGYNLTVEWMNFSDLGWEGIQKILESNNQDCGLHELYRDKWGHYTNYDHVYENTVDVHNSLGDRCNGDCYCGYTENRSKGDALRYLKGISQKSVLVVTRN